LKRVKKIQICSLPDIKNGSSYKPFLEILNAKNFLTLWTNKEEVTLENYKPGADCEFEVYDIKPRRSVEGMQNLFSGDIYFRIKAKGQYGDKLICRFAVNTSFIKKN